MEEGRLPREAYTLRRNFPGSLAQEGVQREQDVQRHGEVNRCGISRVQNYLIYLKLKM